MEESLISYFVINTQTHQNFAAARQKENEILVHASDLVFMHVLLAGLSRREIRNCLYSRVFVGEQSVLGAQLATVENGLSSRTNRETLLVLVNIE